MTHNGLIAFATCESLPELTANDRLAAEALRHRGHAVVAAVWDDPGASWTAYDAVVVRSCWDYPERAAAFRDWLDRLDDLGCALWNSTDTVRWNLDKLYLRTLHQHGVPVVPTLVLERGDAASLSELADRLEARELVVKPRIGISGLGTWRTAWERFGEDSERFRDLLDRQAVLVQPLVPEILSRGEWSLVYFEGVFSHAVLKRACAGEFRVQHEWGGTEELLAPPPPLVELAERVLDEIEHVLPPPLYARVDLVEADGGGLLMELELIEPDLFFQLDRGSALRFCTAVEGRL